MNKLVAEAFGTFTLVFAGTWAVVVNQTQGGTVGHVGICLTFGLAVMVMIYALGDISGCHINPAVTLGFTLAGRMKLPTAAGYMIAQVIGAILASLLLKMLFPEGNTLVLNSPGGEAWRSLVLEGVMTFFLMFVVLCVSTGAKEKGITAGIAIGGTITLDSLFGGPISGASMNPARSLAPALVGGHFVNLWLYVVGPLAGAALAVPFHKVLTRGLYPPSPSL